MYFAEFNVTTYFGLKKVIQKGIVKGCWKNTEKILRKGVRKVTQKEKLYGKDQRK